MALLDFIKSHFASQQQPAASTPQPSTPPLPAVESLPAHVKVQAVEAARPAAAAMDNASAPSSAPVQAQSVPNIRARGLSLGR